MRSQILRFTARFLPGLLAVGALPCAGQGEPPGRVSVRFDVAEATAALDLVEAGRRGIVPEGEWRRLFATEGYARLKVREAAMRRAFTDSSFAAFVQSDTLARRAPALRAALRAWEGVDVRSAAARALAYLPEDARIHATVYIVVKPRSNSFVWDLDRDPAIFLYLDPEVTPTKLENTIAHELHHIGFASVRARADSLAAALPDNVRPAAEWMGAFGEGFAMLAAAGGPDVHPHATSPDSDRARWDRDVANVNADIGQLEQFFQDIISRRLATPDTIGAVAAGFYGIQGPWYTVGWKMAVAIERRFGRAELIRCMTDPRRLLVRYNEAAADFNRTHADQLARWSPSLVAALGGGS